MIASIVQESGFAAKNITLAEAVFLARKQFIGLASSVEQTCRLPCAGEGGGPVGWRRDRRDIGRVAGTAAPRS